MLAPCCCCASSSPATLRLHSVCCSPRFPNPLQVYKTPSSLHSASVNSIAFAPHELGLVLACASSDGSVSVLEHKPDGSWDASKVCPLSPSCAAAVSHMNVQKRTEFSACQLL